MSDYAVAWEDLESTEDVGDYEFDDELAAWLEEDDEARRRGGRSPRRPVRTGRGAGYYRPRPSPQYVTQTQLQAALAKIGNDVKANAAGIKTVGARVDTVTADQRKQADILKKEIADRRRDIARIRSNSQLSSILPLVMSRSITIPAGAEVGGVTLASETKLSVAPDPLMALLPLFLSPSNGSGNSGGDGGMAIALLAASGGL